MLYIITTTKLKCGNIGEEGAGKGQKKNKTRSNYKG